MNRTNIEFALATMIQVLAKEQETGSKLTCMTSWQGNILTTNSPAIANTLTDLHQCGNTACLAGHLALTPAFQKMGVENLGREFIVPGDNVSMFFSAWFGFKSPGLSSYFILDNFILNNPSQTHAFSGFEGFGFSSKLVYGKSWPKITTVEVIEALTYVLEHGEKAFVQRMVDRLKSLAIDTKEFDYCFSFITLLKNHDLFDQI